MAALSSRTKILISLIAIAMLSLACSTTRTPRDFKITSITEKTIDIDSDGKIDGLHFFIEVSPQSKDSYVWKGTLADSQGKVITITTGIGEAGGQSPLVFRFRGDDIYKHGASGQFVLKDVEIALLNSSVAAFSSTLPIYTSAEYARSKFSDHIDPVRQNVQIDGQAGHANLPIRGQQARFSFYGSADQDTSFFVYPKDDCSLYQPDGKLLLSGCGRGTIRLPQSGTYEAVFTSLNDGHYQDQWTFLVSSLLVKSIRIDQPPTTVVLRRGQLGYLKFNTTDDKLIEFSQSSTSEVSFDIARPFRISEGTSPLYTFRPYEMGEGKGLMVLPKGQSYVIAIYPESQDDSSVATQTYTISLTSFASHLLPLNTVVNAQTSNWAKPLLFHFRAQANQKIRLKIQGPNLDKAKISMSSNNSAYALSDTDRFFDGGLKPNRDGIIEGAMTTGDDNYIIQLIPPPDILGTYQVSISSAN